MPTPPTIYPPTPDPFSVPSSRQSLNLSRQSIQSTTSYHDFVDPESPSPQSSPDLDDSPNPYSALPLKERSTTEGDLGDFSRLQGDEVERVRSDRSSRRISQALVGGLGLHESDSMLQPNSLQLHPLSPPDQHSELFVEGNRPNSSFSNAYSRYSSNGQSTQDFSDEDGDSQRGLNRNLESGMGGRRGSTLAFGGNYDEKDMNTTTPYPTGTKKSMWAKQTARGKKIIIFSVVIAAIIIAIVAGTSISLSGKRNQANSFAAGGATSGYEPNTATSSLSARPAPTGVTTGNGTAAFDWRTASTGGDKSIVYTADGSSFVYNNSFGGFWNSIPFNDSAQVAFDSPPLNRPWNFDTNRINGVNLGGWLVIEPFISPALFEPFSSGDGGWGTPATVVDEWTLSIALGDKMASTIENHYATFITEKDFAEIAAAGLNWVRIPIGYWIVETYPGEPFLAKVGWKYFLQALVWARKYGLRVNLDLHAIPGSQNGYNHSSKQGTINFLNGVMGLANGQRTLNYIRTLTEFISQPEYVNLVPMFSVVNEPSATTIGVDNIRTFYLEVYEVIRGITGIGAGKGPMIVFHDGFVPYATPIADGGWNGFLIGADRMALDSHPYICFAAPNNDGLSYQAAKPCSSWANAFNRTRQGFGVFVAAEFSLAINDCGKWINNVGNGQRFNGTYRIPGTTNPQYAGLGSCEEWDNWESYSATRKAGFRLVAEGHMDALKDWFFWTWKTGYSPQKGKVINPMWNYQLALAQGFMPADPRIANGACPSLVSANSQTMINNPAPTFSSWQTGGAGAGQVDAAQLTQWKDYAPTLTATAGGLIYTPTQLIITLPSGPSPTSFPVGFPQSVNIGNGWANPSDAVLMNTPIATCSYLNPWSGAGAPIPTGCGGSGSRVKREQLAFKPTPTPKPMRF